MPSETIDMTAVKTDLKPKTTKPVWRNLFVRPEMGTFALLILSIIAGSLTWQSVFQTAVEQDCDLIVVGGYNKQPLSKAVVAAWQLETPPDVRRPVLICP